MRTASPSRCSRAARYVAYHGCTYVEAGRMFGVSPEAVRTTLKRQEMRRVDRLSPRALAVRLVEAGETCRKAALVYRLSADDVLAAFNRKWPERARSFT